jgi:hypothetical protein
MDLFGRIREFHYLRYRQSISYTACPPQTSTEDPAAPPCRGRVERPSPAAFGFHLRKLHGPTVGPFDPAQMRWLDLIG